MVPGECFVLMHVERQTSFGAWRLANVVYGDASTYTSRQLSSVVSFSEVTQLLNESKFIKRGFLLLMGVHSCHHCLISGFCRDAFEICSIPRYYAAYSGSFLPTFRDNLFVPSSRVKKSV